MIHAQITGIEHVFRSGDLVYFSDLERKSFSDFLDGNPDYLAMIAAVNPGTSERELKLYSDWVDEIIVSIRGKKFDEFSDEKKIERIEKYVKSALLVNYKHNADFEFIKNKT